MITKDEFQMMMDVLFKPLFEGVYKEHARLAIRLDTEVTQLHARLNRVERLLTEGKVDR